ncbi:MAG: AAA family ATPase, partial [Marmoricola sp.]
AADKPISQFSGGMRRRLDLAASLITRPPLIFLDEPTTGLDPRTRGQMWTTIRELVRDGCTVLLTTQYLDEADQLADRIAVIDRGVKVAQGTPDELKASVGRSTLQLQLVSGDLLPEAARIAESVVGEAPVLTPEARRMNIALQRSDQAVDVLIGLREQDIAIESMTVQKPSLDEVFLALTGHDTGEAPAGATPDPDHTQDLETVR